MRFSISSWVAALGLLGCARGFSDKPALQTVVRDATERGALCNDGTEAVYYFQPSASGSARWVVHMKGGFWCWDAASCGARASNLMGTATWPKSIYCPYPYKPTDPFYDLCTGAFNPDAAQNPLFHVRCCCLPAIPGLPRC